LGSRPRPSTCGAALVTLHRCSSHVGSLRSSLFLRAPPHARWRVDASFRRQRCGGCRHLFYVCRTCDHGQLYCGSACRLQARSISRRRARARHQSSPEGRLDHRDRQRLYRERCRVRVTDQGSPKPSLEATVVVPPAPSPSPERERCGAPRVPFPPGQLVCRFCGDISFFVRRSFLRRRSRARVR
jgi:hypothetical protein